MSAATTVHLESDIKRVPTLNSLVEFVFDRLKARHRFNNFKAHVLDNRSIAHYRIDD